MATQCHCRRVVRTGVAEGPGHCKGDKGEGLIYIRAVYRNSDMDCGLVCPEFRGVFPRVPAHAGFPTAARLARGPVSCGPHLRAARARAVRVWATRELVFSFFQRISKCFSNLVLS